MEEMGSPNAGSTFIRDLRMYSGGLWRRLLVIVASEADCEGPMEETSEEGDLW